MTAGFTCPPSVAVGLWCWGMWGSFPPDLSSDGFRDWGGHAIPKALGLKWSSAGGLTHLAYTTSSGCLAVAGQTSPFSMGAMFRYHSWNGPQKPSSPTPSSYQWKKLRPREVKSQVIKARVWMQVLSSQIPLYHSNFPREGLEKHPKCSLTMESFSCKDFFLFFPVSPSHWSGWQNLTLRNPNKNLGQTSKKFTKMP